MNNKNNRCRFLKITMRRHLLFKCHCNKIYFVFPKVIVSWHIHDWQDSVSGDISSTIPKVLSSYRAIYNVQQIMQQYQITEDVTDFKIYDVQQIIQQHWIMEDTTNFKIVCLWGTLVILMPLYALLSLIFSNIYPLFTWMDW